MEKNSLHFFTDSSSSVSSLQMKFVGKTNETTPNINPKTPVYENFGSYPYIPTKTNFDGCYNNRN